MKKFDFTVPHDGREVHGRAYFPDDQSDAGGSFPLVIFSHGYNGGIDDFALTAEYFATHGVAAACIAFCGGGVRDVSGFPTTSMTITTEVEDLAAVVDFFRARGDVDSGGIFLFGGSMGGLVSLLTAHKLGKDKIRGLILLYPALCIADDWNARFPNESDIPESLDFWGMTLGRGFFLSLRALDIEGALSSYQNDILIMHGDRDPVVPVEYGSRASGLCGAELFVFAGEGHGFSPSATLRMEGMTMHFVRTHIGK